MNKNTKLIIGLACMSLGLTACTEDYFDQEKYDARIQKSFPVENVNPNHTWATYGSATVNVTVGGDDNECYTVEIYKEDPTKNRKLTVLASEKVFGTESAQMIFSFELASPTAYVSLYNKANHRWTKQIVVADGDVVGVGFLGAAPALSRTTRSQEAPVVAHIAAPYDAEWVADYLATAKEPDNVNIYDNYDNSIYIEAKEPEWVVTGRKWVVDVPGHNEDIIENKWVEGVAWGWGWKGVANALAYNYENQYFNYKENGISDEDYAFWMKYCVPFQKEQWSFYDGATNKEDATYVLMGYLESTGRKSTWCNIWAEGKRGGYQDVVVGQQWVAEQGHYEEDGYMTEGEDAHWEYDETYVRNFKITQTWNGTINVVTSEGIQNGQRSNAERTVVVTGTWNLTETQRVGSLGKIIVADGGTITISSGKALELVNQARLVVLEGGTVNGDGEVMVTNGNATGLEGYNGGIIDIHKVNNNFGKFFNYGTFKADIYAAGSQESNFYNHGLAVIEGTKEYGNYVSSNARVFNACQWYCKGDMRLRDYEGVMGSSLLVDGELMLSLSEDGTTDPTYVGLAAGALVKCGTLYNNGSNWSGPTQGGHAVVSIGQITYLNWAQDTYPLSGGYFENNIYVEIEDATNVPDGNGMHQTDTNDAYNHSLSTAEYKFWNIVANGLDGRTDIRGNGGVTKVTASNSDSNEIIPADKEFAKGVKGCTPGYKGKSDVQEDDPNDDQDKTPQSFRFCFEDNFPSPGDYDFNDCVITVTPTVSYNTVTLKVSLDAVGATKQIAAALRIKGITPNDVLSGTNDFTDYAAKYASMRYITPVKNDKGSTLYYLDPAKLGMDANGNQITDFVVSLFNDAHWAMSGADATGNNQYLHTNFYNTISSEETKYEKVNKVVDPVEMELTFTLASNDLAQYFKDVSRYDLFIIEESSNRSWEVHTYPYKFDQVVAQWADYTDKYAPYINSTTKNYPWAIQVPGDFLYPIEWQSISGSKIAGKEGYGEGTAAYTLFKEWAVNPNTDDTNVQQWYLKENIENLKLVWQKPAQ